MPIGGRNATRNTSTARAAAACPRARSSHWPVAHTPHQTERAEYADYAELEEQECGRVEHPRPLVIAEEGREERPVAERADGRDMQDERRDMLLDARPEGQQNGRRQHQRRRPGPDPAYRGGRPPKRPAVVPLVGEHQRPDRDRRRQQHVRGKSGERCEQERRDEHRRAVDLVAQPVEAEQRDEDRCDIVRRPQQREVWRVELAFENGNPRMEVHRRDQQPQPPDPGRKRPLRDERVHDVGRPDHEIESSEEHTSGSGSEGFGGVATQPPPRHREEHERIGGGGEQGEPEQDGEHVDGPPGRTMDRRREKMEGIVVASAFVGEQVGIRRRQRARGVERARHHQVQVPVAEPHDVYAVGPRPAVRIEGDCDEQREGGREQQERCEPGGKRAPRGRLARPCGDED